MKKFCCAWSGGKDSALAYYKALQQGWKPVCLLTMCVKGGLRTRSHGLSTQVIRAQADALGVPVYFQQAESWDVYTAKFREKLKEIKIIHSDLEVLLCGDIDIEEHRQWNENSAKAADLTAEMPLWKMIRDDVMSQLIQAEFQMLIVTVHTPKISENFLGQVITKELIEGFEQMGVDACGESGEYHSVLTNAPMFNKPIHLVRGAIHKISDYASVDFMLDRNILSD